MTTALKQRWVLAVLVMFFAGALRFYRLGDWAFANDELGTIDEEKGAFRTRRRRPGKSSLSDFPRHPPELFFPPPRRQPVRPRRVRLPRRAGDLRNAWSRNGLPAA